jgi:LPS-assembly protein
MNHRNKGKAKNILAWSFPLLFILLTYHFEGFARYRFQSSPIAIVDTPPPVIKIPDTSRIPRPKTRVPSISEEKTATDTTFTVFSDTLFPFKRSKDSLSAPVVYHADDSIVYDVPTQRMILYGKISSINYSGSNLSAPQIEYDQRTSLIKATLTKDSTGRVVSYPYFSQAGTETVSDTILVNMKTGKGLTKGTYTKQGEMFVYGEKIKKVDTSTFYAYRARFTTCNLDTPHFAFVAKNVKFVNKKWAYTGPVHPEFEGVPLPISLPFGIFPLSTGRHSGLLAPSFTANEQLGLTLENLGYYKIISPNWDVVTRGSVYSYGSYTMNVNPRYYRRYHYQGSMSFALQKIKPLDEKGTRTINVQWTHTADTKSRPGVSFSANVNAGSTKFNSQVPNAPRTNFTNQLNSSISYAKVWKNHPYNISINANHNQNAVSGLINLNLPDIAFNVNTLYPFRRSEAVDLKWYENIGVGYNGNAKSLTSFYDTAGHISKQIKDNLQYGAHHSIPITLSLPPISFMQISPSMSYDETWYQQKLTKQYNPLTQKIDTTSRQKGFYTARQMSFGLSLSTRIFGMFGFSEKSKVKAIRHEIRPTISINYSPNMNARSYYYATIDSFNTRQRYSYFDGNIYGAYSGQRFGGISFSLDNNITMKVRDKSDTSAKADKKVSLLDGLSLNGAYNFLADSFKLSPLTLSARNTIAEKINISAGASFDPYQRNSLGADIDRLVWAKNPFTLGHLTSGNIALSSHFQGGSKKNTGTSGNQAVNNLQNVNASGLPLDDYQREAAYIQNNPGEFADFDIPWDADLSYSLLYTNAYDYISRSFQNTYTQSVNFNTSANLSERWKVGVNGTYDITNKKIQTVSMYLSRDLHCWQMSINISPVGIYRFFSINISPKSPMLRDLKVNRTRSFYEL